MSKVDMYKERLQKAEENVEKRKATIERHKAQLEKRIAKIAKVGWIDVTNLSNYTYDDAARRRYEQETGSQLYWDICDVRDKEQDIKDSYKKLEELEQIAQNWRTKLEKAEFNADFWNREIPESLKSYRDYLTSEWDKWDKERRATLKLKYKELGYSEFVKRYKYSGYEFLSITDDQIHSDNERDATDLILDLYCRVFKYTGKITSWDYLTISQGHINGWVSGERANAKVESILAGGYNIQRLHVRVLVHAYDKPIPTTKTEAKTETEKQPSKSKEYKDMTLEELEQLAERLGATYKKCNNDSINRMRLVVAIKKMAN